jgi:pyridoxal phosphate enzyme (YggS family)
MAQRGDLELTLPFNDSESITTRFQKTAETIRILSKAQFGIEEKVKLVVVTKGQPLEACLEVIAAGATNLGENYPEETFKKFDGVTLGSTNLHMIGHIQSRKIKLLYPLFQYIHSIDNLMLARKINNYYIQKGVKNDALIEVDFTSVFTKNGFRVNETTEYANFINSFEELLKLEGLNIIGLMTMGNYPENEETNREIFKACRRLLNAIKDKYKAKTLCELSMGTSGDYKTAIAEGSTMVRIGELIMGPRVYLKKEIV